GPGLLEAFQRGHDGGAFAPVVFVANDARVGRTGHVGGIIGGSVVDHHDLPDVWFGASDNVGDPASLVVSRNQCDDSVTHWGSALRRASRQTRRSWPAADRPRCPKDHGTETTVRCAG